MVTEFHLPNGLHCILARCPRVPLFAIRLRVHAGFASDLVGKPHLSHLVEHLLFRSRAGTTPEQLAASGAYLNGYTKTNFVDYQANAHTDLTQPCLNFIRSLLVAPKISKAQVAAERKTLHHELRETGPSRLRIDQAHFEFLAGRRVARNHRDVIPQTSKISAKDVNAFWEANYTATNSRLVIVGPWSLEESQRRVEDIFGDLPTANVTEPNVTEPNVTEPKHPVLPSRRRMYWSFFNHPPVIIAWHVLGKPSAAETLASAVLDQITGGSMAGGMFTRLREQQRLCYTTGSDILMEPSQLAQTHYLYTSTPKVGRSLRELRKMLIEAKDPKAISQLSDHMDAFRRKTELRNSFPVELADWLLEWSVRRTHDDQLFTPEAALKLLPKITAEHLAEFASRLYSSANRRLGLFGRIGPMAYFCGRAFVRPQD